MHVIAVGSILSGSLGLLSARGGFGGGGENTAFLNRVGGGSGGHVILECGAMLDLRAKSAVSMGLLTDNGWAIDVRGGQGGAGSSDLGGAYLSVNGQTETLPGQDACPPGYRITGVNSCRGHVDDAGGDGGPGIVQLHTRTGRVGTSPASADILLASGATLATTCAPEPLFAQGSTGPNPAHFINGAGGALALFQMDSTDCDGDGTPDRCEIALDGSLDANGNGVLDTCESPTYCTSSTSTNGCVARMACIGTPSASANSGFELIANDVEGARSGRMFYGFTTAAIPWAPASTSFQCIASPLQRVPLSSSGGTSGSCNGSLALDWNAWRAAHPTAAGAPFGAGDVLHAQAWFRDPGAPRGTNLSDAVTFTLLP